MNNDYSSFKATIYISFGYILIILSNHVLHGIEQVFGLIMSIMFMVGGFVGVCKKSYWTFK